MQSVILGTAQWGLDYGVTNTGGRLADDAVLDLADTAWALGIRTLDTAPSYGDAEQRISTLRHGFEVQTKVSVADVSQAAVGTSVRLSLSRVKGKVLSAVLIHDWSTADATHRSQAATALEELRGEGLVAAVGVSGYDETDIDSALSTFKRLDVVQVPVSILDQRLTGSPAIKELRLRGGLVQARSVFLQGAALAREGHRALGRHPDVVRLRSAGRALDLCLGYVASLEWVDEVVLAATTGKELEEIMAATASAGAVEDWAALASEDPWLVDPRLWTAPTGRG